METTNEVKRYTCAEVLASQPGIEDAMHLVMLNALETGASNDRMFLKMSQGSLAGLNLLWDQPSLTWVVKGAHVPEDESTRLLDEDAWVCLCGRPIAADETQCHECRDGFGDAELGQGVE